MAKTRAGIVFLMEHASYIERGEEINDVMRKRIADDLREAAAMLITYEQVQGLLRELGILRRGDGL